MTDRIPTDRILADSIRGCLLSCVVMLVFCFMTAYQTYNYMVLTKENLAEQRLVEKRISDMCAEAMISNRKTMGALGIRQ